MQLGDKKTSEYQKIVVYGMSWRMAEQEWRKGPWTPEEDSLLVEYVRMHGEGRWSSVAGCSGIIKQCTEKKLKSVLTTKLKGIKGLTATVSLFDPVTTRAEPHEVEKKKLFIILA